MRHNRLTDCLTAAPPSPPPTAQPPPVNHQLLVLIPNYLENTLGGVAMLRAIMEVGG